MTLTRGKFPPHSRLKKRREFKTVLNYGSSRSSRTAVVYAHPSATTQHRLGLIVSRRVGKAVVRNRIKRIMRELFRQRRHELRSSSPLDFVVIAKRRAVDTQPQLPADLLLTMQTLAQKIARSSTTC